MKVFQLTLILFQLSVICCSYYFQYPRYSILHNNTFLTDYKVYYSDYYIILKNETHFLVYQTDFQILKFTLSINNFIKNTEAIVDYEINDYKQLFLLVQSNTNFQARIVLITLDKITGQSFSQTYMNLNNTKYTDIQIIPLQIIIFDELNAKIIKIDRIKKSQIESISTNYKVNRKIKTCRITNQKVFIVNWSSYCYIQLYQCYSNLPCALKLRQGSICSNNEYLLNFDVSFNQDCTFLSYLSKRTNYTRFFYTKSYTFNTSINSSSMIYFQDIQLLNSANIFYSYKSNKSQISVYSNNISKIALQPLFKINFLNDFNKSKYNLENGTIFTFNSNGFQLYNAYCQNTSLKYFQGQCIICTVQFCSRCNTSGSCIECQNGYNLFSNMICLKILNNIINEKSFNFISKIPEMEFQVINSITFKNIRKIPGLNRILLKYFPILMDIQNLWLYSYHEKNYGSYINSLFKSIRQIQSQKRVIIKGSFLQTDQFINMTSIQSKIDFKYQYQSKKYYYQEGIGNSFLVNTLDFFIANIPICLLYLFIGKQLSIIFKWSFLKVFRFYLCFFIMILEGNYQTFSYFFAADLRSFFNLSLKVKIMNLTTILLFYIFIFLVSLLYLIIKIRYDRKSQILFDICKDNLKGCMFLLVHKGLKNLALGIFHLIIEDKGPVKLIILSLIEKNYAIFLIVNLYQNQKQKLFCKKLLIWGYIFISYEQILLNFTFIFEQIINSQQSDVFYMIQSFILIFKNYRIVIFYVVSLIVFIITFWQNIYINSRYFINQQQNQLQFSKKNRTKQNNKLIKLIKKQIKKSKSIKNIENDCKRNKKLFQSQKNNQKIQIKGKQRMMYKKYQQNEYKVNNYNNNKKFNGRCPKIWIK